MMSTFLVRHTDDLISRCAGKAALRFTGKLPREHTDGLPLFIGQLQKTLEAEELHREDESLRISGAPGGDVLVLSEMGISATANGRKLSELGYSVDEVVHTYGDLCQAITDLAFERKAPFSVSEFRTLNRSLDNAISSAVTAFSRARDASYAAQQSADVSARVDVLVQELRSSLATATYAIAAMDAGNLPMSGATGSVLKKCVAAMRLQIGGPTLEEVRTTHEGGST
jgi:hypothetical protein